MRLRRSKGEMVEVEGGRIVRSLGRKDRHSKVCTVKGPRHRRVRLSANTAIQFYDLQDRLGYDRPSKAIDWLMNEAKAAIDALNENQLDLPASTASIYNNNPSQAFHRTSGEGIHNQASNSFSFFNNYQDLHLSLQENQIPVQESLFSASTPVDFTGEMVQLQKMLNWNSNSNSSSGNGKEQYPFGPNKLFSPDREPLQFSFPIPIHGVGNDDEFLGFPFPQGIQGKEEDDILVSKQVVSSAIQLLHYQ